MLKGVGASKNGGIDIASLRRRGDVQTNGRLRSIVVAAKASSQETSAREAEGRNRHLTRVAFCWRIMAASWLAARELSEVMPSAKIERNRAAAKRRETWAAWHVCCRRSWRR